MTTDRTQEVLDLRSEGYDCFQIARKLEMTVIDVEAIVYGDKNIDPELLQLVHWGVHY